VIGSAFPRPGHLNFRTSSSRQDVRSPCHRLRPWRCWKSGPVVARLAAKEKVASVHRPQPPPGWSPSGKPTERQPSALQPVPFARESRHAAKRPKSSQDRRSPRDCRAGTRSVSSRITVAATLLAPTRVLKQRALFASVSRTSNGFLR